MRKNKNNKPIWGTRIKNDGSVLFKKVGSSLAIDKRLFKEDIEGSIAHVEMLHKQKILNFKIKNKIIWGLNRIKNEIIKKKFNFNYELEDIHMNIEDRLFEIIGDDAGYIHTARSRNDQVITDLKLWLKEATKKIINLIDSTNSNILKLAQKNVRTIMPGFTHLKNAQPISLGHYLLAYIEMFKRDKKKFQNNFEFLDENPLGVGALAGTSFKINRHYTTKKLKFKKPTDNSVDTVSDRDFVMDFLYSSLACSLHISRIAEELIIWNSDGFNMITLNDKLVTGSSIMPQKKNPDPLEYLRGKTGTFIGNINSMISILKGLPISYFKDLQDDKEIVFKTNDQLKISLSLLNDVIKNLIINKNKMLSLAEKGFITATDLTDYIVRELKYPFRKAYILTAKIINLAEKKNKKLHELELRDFKQIEPKLTLEVYNILDLESSVNSKKSYGGTSFENVRKMIKKVKKKNV